MLCTDRPGPCVVLTKSIGEVTGFSNSEITWTIPFYDETKFTATQKLRQPVKEFFNDLKDFVINSGGVIGGLADLAFQGLDMFGVQLFQKGFYAQAWAGEEPTPFSLTFKFFLGMQGKWDAFTEVFNPVMAIMQQTVPRSLEEPPDSISPPAPSPFAVFTQFAGNIIQRVISGNSGASSATALGQFAVDTTQNTFRNTTTVNGGTWDVGFGWTNGNVSLSPKIYYLIPLTVVESSTWSFSPMTQLVGDNVYPITGELQLNFRTQALLTNATMTDHQGRRI
jgi:hypothetical protein